MLHIIVRPDSPVSYSEFRRIFDEFAGDKGASFSEGRGYLMITFDVVSDTVPDTLAADLFDAVVVNAHDRGYLIEDMRAFIGTYDPPVTYIFNPNSDPEDEIEARFDSITEYRTVEEAFDL